MKAPPRDGREKIPRLDVRAAGDDHGIANHAGATVPGLGPARGSSFRARSSARSIAARQPGQRCIGRAAARPQREHRIERL